MVVFVKCRKQQQVNVSSGRMSLRLAGTKTRENRKGILYVFADKEYCMSLRTAMIVFVKCRRYESKCFFRLYVFVDCDHEDKIRSKSNIVCVCGLQ